MAAWLQIATHAKSAAGKNTDPPGQPGNSRHSGYAVVLTKRAGSGNRLRVQRFSLSFDQLHSRRNTDPGFSEDHGNYHGAIGVIRHTAAAAMVI